MLRTNTTKGLLEAETLLVRGPECLGFILGWRELGLWMSRALSCGYDPQLGDALAEVT